MEQVIFEFLKELKINNNREWFQVNKNRYNQAREAFESFVNELIPGIRELDPLIGTVTAKDCAFRIYRDVRFSSDKSPYKTNMGAYIARGGKSAHMAGYYVHVEPGGSFLAGGLYMPPPDVLKKVRDEICFQPEEFKKIVYGKKFLSVFGEIDDPEKLKTPPKGYPKEFPDINLLKFKNYAVMHYIPDDLALKDTYAEYAISVFRVLQPLNAWFNRLFI